MLAMSILSACTHPTIEHADLVDAAASLGAGCEPRNDQGVTVCTFGDDLNAPFLQLIDGNEDFAESEYQHRCLSNEDFGQEWIWYDDSDWMFQVFKKDISSDGVKIVSKRLGLDTQDC